MNDWKGRDPEEVDRLIHLIKQSPTFQKFERNNPEGLRRLRRLVEDGEPNLNAFFDRFLLLAEKTDARRGERWAQQYGLTQAETALAAALVAGGSLREFAEQSGKKQSTARSQLLSIFRKTNTARQIELVQLLKQ